MFGHLWVPGPGATLNEPSEADFDMDEDESMYMDFDSGASTIPFPGLSHSDFIT